MLIDWLDNRRQIMMAMNRDNVGAGGWHGSHQGQAHTTGWQGWEG